MCECAKVDTQPQMFQSSVFLQNASVGNESYFLLPCQFRFVGILYHFLLVFPSIFGDFQPRVCNCWHPSRDAIFQSSRQQRVEEDACNRLSHHLPYPPPLQESESNCIIDGLAVQGKEESGKGSKGFLLFLLFITSPLGLIETYYF